MSKRARGEGHLFRRGRIWWLAFYAHGRQIRESTNTDDEKKAARLLRRRLGEVAAGIHKDEQNLSYQELRKSFVSDYEVNHRKSLYRDASGQPKIDALFHLDKYFDGWRARDIDTDALRRFITDKQ